MKKVNKKQNIKKIKKTYDLYLIVIVFVLIAIGLIMVLSASSPSAFKLTGNAYFYLQRQAFFAVLGTIVMIIFMKIDYKFYKNPIIWSWVGIISIIILFAVLIPGIGIESQGGRRWITIPYLTNLQPSEITKIGAIIFIAGFLSNNKKEIDRQKTFWTPIVFLGIIGAILFLVQNHVSSILIILLIGITIMLQAGIKFRNFVFYGIPLGAIRIKHNVFFS